MKYQSSNTKIIFDLDFAVTNSKMSKCPECTQSRKKQNKKDLKYYSDTNRAYCFHCNTTFFEYKPFEKNKEYAIPTWKNKTDLTDKAVKWFTSRMISQDVLNKMKVYSSNEWMPQFQKEVETICFPFFKDEVLKNVKYRGANKSFKLYSGAELVWYNFDALKNNNEIIICEGEIDLLTWVQNGYENVISVPNGAGGNVEYLDNSIDFFENIDKVYLSTDNDSQGVVLRDELIRRLGAEKCSLINFKQYKDANDYLVGESGLEFKKLVKNAKSIPIDGVVEIESIERDILDLYEYGEKPGLSIESKTDEFLTWELRRLVTVTGVPQSGKSEWVDYVITKLNLMYGWKAALFTPENYPLQYHYRKLHTKFSGCKFEKKTDTTDFWNIYEHIKNNFYYILNNDDNSVDNVLGIAKGLIKKHGIKMLVIDPYNKLEHNYKNGTAETQYISKFLDKIVSFAQINNILLFLVAHPRKMDRGIVPSLYDIAGSANFYNKTDIGVTVDRPRDEDGSMGNCVDVYVQKVKFKHLGSQGVSDMNYNYNNGRYEDINDSIDQWDNKPWIGEVLEQRNTTMIGIEPQGINTFDEIDEIPF